MFDLLFTTSASWSRSLGFCDWFSRLLMAGRHQSANCAAGSAVAGTLPRALLGPRHTEGGEGHHKGGPPAWVQSGWCLACHGISKIHQVPAGCHPVLLEVLAGACWWMLLLYLRAHGLQCAESWIRSLLERNLEKLWWKWSLTFGSFMFMSNINMFDIWTVWFWHTPPTYMAFLFCIDSKFTTCPSTLYQLGSPKRIVFVRSDDGSLTSELKQCMDPSLQKWLISEMAENRLECNQAGWKSTRKNHVFFCVGNVPMLDMCTLW